MKRTALALTLIIVILLTSTAVVAYYVSLNHSSQGENFLPASPPPTSTSTSSTIPGEFAGPLGNFEISSPSNSTYNTNPVTLNVTGQVIYGSNVELLMNYSLDGQESLPLPVVVQALTGNPFAVAITGSVTLPKLSDGSHSITVFGD